METAATVFILLLVIILTWLICYLGVMWWKAWNEAGRMTEDVRRAKAESLVMYTHARHPQDHPVRVVAGRHRRASQSSGGATGGAGPSGAPHGHHRPASMEHLAVDPNAPAHSRSYPV